MVLNSIRPKILFLKHILLYILKIICLKYTVLLFMSNSYKCRLRSRDGLNDKSHATSCSLMSLSKMVPNFLALLPMKQSLDYLYTFTYTLLLQGILKFHRTKACSSHARSSIILVHNHLITIMLPTISKCAI